MKRKLTATLLSLALVLALIPFSALAVNFPPATAVPEIVLFEERKDSNGEPFLYCEFSAPQSVMDVVATEEIAIFVDSAFKVDDNPWQDDGEATVLYALSPYETIEGTTNRYFINFLADNDATDGSIDIKGHKYTVKLFFSAYVEGVSYRTNFSAEASAGGSAFQSSDWAKAELQRAADLGLIPESLKTADLTKSITRAEFAAVAVKVYENLSGTKAIPAVNNPFTDTADVEVLKAFNVGITAGTSATTFSPNELLNREQAATMLTRVFKKVSMVGWTFATDADFTLDYTQPAKFSDDEKISAFAKDSVYFMVANKIISGMGDGTFAPRAITSQEQAANYASATREQALAIALRMVENLKT